MSIEKRGTNTYERWRLIETSIEKKGPTQMSVRDQYKRVLEKD